MRRTVSITVMLLATLCAALAVFAQQGPAPTGNHVIIITLDGFPGWALEDPYLPVPNLRRLAANGALAAGMRPVNPTVTWPNHTSLVTGVTPAKYGVLFNGTLVRDPGVLRASGRGIKPGAKLKSVDNVDVAPTAAKLLGVELKNVDGRVLTEILQSK